MAYWICTEAKIEDEGRTVVLAFKDAHSCSTIRSTLPAEEWQMIHVYRGAYEEPHRRVVQLHQQLVQAMWDAMKAKAGD